MTGFNGNGTFVRAHNWIQDANIGIPISASRFDEEDNAFATGLSGCITKDGQTTLTANIPFNNNKIFNLAVGTSRTDSINLGQVQDNQFLDLGTLGGSADAYTGGISPNITNYVASMRFTGVIPATNLTTTPYLQVSGIANPASNAVIKKMDIDGNEIALQVGDLVINAIGDFKRNITNNAWILLNPRNLSSGSFSNLSVDNLTVGKYISGGMFNNTPPILSNDIADAANDINFSAGGVFDKVNNVGWFSSALTKRLDAIWTAGTNQGGLDTGSKANSTWYNCYGIYNPTLLLSDIIFSYNNSLPALPSGYTKYAYLGSIRTDSSGNIFGFQQFGNYFYFSSAKADVSITNPGILANLRSLTVPARLGIFPLFTAAVRTINVNTFYLITSPAQVDATPGSTLFDIQLINGDSESGSISKRIMSNASSQIRTRFSTNEAGLEEMIFTDGWIDTGI